MHFAFICFLIVLVPFLCEKFYFGIKFGPFFVLLCVFVFQFSSLVAADFFLGLKAVAESAPWVVALLGGLGTASMMTIALVPALSAIGMIFWIVSKSLKKFLGNSQPEA